jgi:hypothetical protein
MPFISDFELEMNGIGFSESKSLSGSRQCFLYRDFDPDLDSSQCQGEEAPTFGREASRFEYQTARDRGVYGGVIRGVQ